MKTLKSLVLIAGLSLGSCAVSRGYDFISDISNPASPVSPLNLANPASPLNLALRTTNEQEPLPAGRYNLDYSYCTGRSEKLLKYGLIGLGGMSLALGIYAFFNRGL